LERTEQSVVKKKGKKGDEQNTSCDGTQRDNSSNGFNKALSAQNDNHNTTTSSRRKSKTNLAMPRCIWRNVATPLLIAPQVGVPTPLPDPGFSLTPPARMYRFECVAFPFSLFFLCHCLQLDGGGCCNWGCCCFSLRLTLAPRWSALTSFTPTTPLTFCNRDQHNQTTTRTNRGGTTPFSESRPRIEV